METQVGGQWEAREINVDDSQLVEWKPEGGPLISDDDFSDLGRKR